MSIDSRFRFSVFTATKNRAQLLKRLYQQLKKQTFKDFEWIIVNDGSTDNTDEVVKDFISENLLSIQYVSKQGGGKHTAWRVATNLFKGRYVVTADDDDPITDDMLEIFNKHWCELEKSALYDDFWEVRTRCEDTNGKLVGKELPSPIYDSDYNYVSYKLKVFCEMVGCRKVEVLRNEAAVPNKFIFMDDVSNFDEAIRWSRAARKYKTRFVSDITRIYNNTPNSLSSNVLKRCLEGEKRIIYNKMVEFYYTLTERKDILIKYNIKRYLKTLLGYSFLIAIIDSKSSALEGLSAIQKFVICSILPCAKLYIKFSVKRNEYTHG